MEKMKYKLATTFTLMGLFLFSISIVSAFGASTPYWDENPLRLALGESTIVNLALQNMVGSGEDITLRAILTNDGGGIASLVDVDLDYFVAFGRDDVSLPISVTIPEDSAMGGARNIELSFMQVASDEGGMLTVSGGFTTRIPVYVVVPQESVLFEEEEIITETPSKGADVWKWALLAIVILALIILWIIKKRYKK